MQTWHGVVARNSPPERECRKALLIRFQLLTRLCALVLGLIEPLARSAWTSFLFSHGMPPVSNLNPEVMKPLQLDQLRCMIQSQYTKIVPNSNIIQLHVISNSCKIIRLWGDYLGWEIKVTKTERKYHFGTRRKGYITGKDTGGGQRTLDPIAVNATLGSTSFCFQVEVH